MKQRNFIARPVARKRNENGWTQDVFADRLQFAGWQDATRSTVSKIEDGSLRIDLVQLYFISRAFGIQPVDLLAGIDWRKQVEKLISFSMNNHNQ
jgi:transcriptional regulator with XRE-family HTH domain